MKVINQTSWLCKIFHSKYIVLFPSSDTIICTKCSAFQAVDLRSRENKHLKERG